MTAEDKMTRAMGCIIAGGAIAVVFVIALIALLAN